MLKSMTFRSTLAAVACAISFSAHALADPKPVNIPAGNLVPALEVLEKQAAIELVFQPEQLKSFRTQGVIGTYEPKDAVRLLLKGTPLELRTDSTGAMVIVPPNSTASLSASDARVKGGDSTGEHSQLAQTNQGGNEANSPVSAPPPSQHSSSRDSGDEGSSAKLEEVVVTAQKREQSLQIVPISAQVISGQTLVDQNQNSLEELTQTVPGVHVSNNGEANILIIRGIGSGGNPSFDQSAAMFVDDIYHGRSRLSETTFLDLERIEVLKGRRARSSGTTPLRAP